MSSYVDQIRQKLLAPPVPEKKWRGLSTGLTLTNLSITGQPDVGILPAEFYTLTGGSQAGKTHFMLQCMAEAAINPDFRKYNIIYNRPERGDLLSISKFFPPLVSRLNKTKSESLEQYYIEVAGLTKGKHPFFHGLDSEDALLSENEKEGGYGLAKAKLNASKIRIAHNGLDKRGSILMMIKQARMNINPMTSKFKPEIRSGGTAIGYFASVELWFKVVGKIRKTVEKKKRTVGSLLRIEVTKNRVSGRPISVTIPFYFSLGFDETESMVRWLCEEDCWEHKAEKGTGEIKEVTGLGITGTLDKVCHRIEEKDLVEKLRAQVCERWKKIEEGCAVRRKPRYA